VAKTEVKTVEIKIADDIEYRVISNAFGLLIASAGLLAGEMVRMRSFEYWLHDIVPLLLILWMVFRLYRNFLSTMVAYHDYVPSPAVLRDRKIRTALKAEQAAVAQISAQTGLSEEEVAAEVSRRAGAN
jgi:ABC-type nickel/cobalt efflux system permease component RcnA